MPIAPELKEILACPKCKGELDLPRGAAADRLQGVQAGLPHRRRHPGHAHRRSQAALAVTLAERLAARPPARALVIQTAYLGDTVFTSALVHALRGRWPAAEIDLCVAPRAQDIARAIPGVAQVHVFDKRGADRGLSGLRRVAARLATRQYPLAVLPHRSLRTSLLALACGTFPSASGFPARPGRCSTRRGCPLPRRLPAPGGRPRPGAGRRTRADAARAAAGMAGRRRDGAGRGRAGEARGGVPGLGVGHQDLAFASRLRSSCACWRIRGFRPVLLGGPKERAVAKEIGAGGACIDTTGNPVGEALAILSSPRWRSAATPASCTPRAPWACPPWPLFGPTAPGMHLFGPAPARADARSPLLSLQRARLAALPARAPSLPARSGRGPAWRPPARKCWRDRSAAGPAAWARGAAPDPRGHRLLPLPGSPPRSIASILVVRTDDRVGNALLTIPLVRALQEALPQAQVDLLLAARRAHLAEGLPRLRVLRFDKRAPPLRQLRFLRGLRARYDVVVDAAHWHAFSLTSALLSRWAARRWLVGHGPGGLRPRPTARSRRFRRRECLTCSPSWSWARPLGLSLRAMPLETALGRGASLRCRGGSPPSIPERASRITAFPPSASASSRAGCATPEACARSFSGDQGKRRSRARSRSPRAARPRLLPPRIWSSSPRPCGRPRWW